jgi:hypothetical protein
MSSPPPIASSTKGRTTFACGSVELAQLSGIARWSLSVTGAADCCAELFPLFSITAPCRPEMSGASALSGTLLLVSLASGPLTCTTCACGSGVRAGAAVRSGHVVVTLGGECSDRCAELSPRAQFYCAISVRDVWGFSVGYLCVFARPCVSRCYAPRVRVAGVRAVTQL